MRSAQVAGAQLPDEALALRGGADIVPQHRRANRPSGRVQRHKAVLLSADRDGGGPARGRAALLERVGEGPPPLLGIAFARAVAAGDGVRGLAVCDDLAGRGVDDQRFGRLGGGVHADDQGAFGCCHRSAPL